MNKLFILIMLPFLIGCKREVPQKPKPKIIVESPRISIEGKIIPIDTSLIQAFKSKLLTDFYISYKNETVWQSSKKRNALLAILKDVEEDGLNPKDYKTGVLLEIEKKFHQLSDKGLVEYDLLLTNSFQKLVSHLSKGKLNPRNIYTDWDLKENKVDINSLLESSLKTDSLAIHIEQARPSHIVYKRLKKALQIINRFPIDTLKKIDFKDKIVLNDTNNSLINIKRRLVYWKDLKPQDSLTAIYDSITFSGIKKFQRRNGLASDGVIGKGTVAALNFSKNQRKQQIIANLERWRWYPKDMGEHYLIINISDFRLTVVKKNDTIGTHKIIVGTSKRKTPILTSKLSYAVFNPTWTVPPTILKEDIIPATTKNRGYLASKNITVYDFNGNEVHANDWDVSKAKSYRYVQSPGTYNSLGMVKLMFPNPFSVYLHDTNHRDYFDRTNLSLSSGCVRVQNVLQLAEYLIDDKASWSEEKITAVLQSEKTTNVTIKQPVYVQQLYWTAWSDEYNNLVFRTDIYNLDADLYNQLGN